MWNDIAVPGFVTEDLDGVICGYHLALVRPNPTLVEAEYLFRAFTSWTLVQQFYRAATGITRYGLSKLAIENAIFPLPPIEEQRQICQWIGSQLVPIDKAIEDARREIQLILELHTRLIVDVVTGKLDVRYAVVSADYAPAEPWNMESSEEELNYDKGANAPDSERVGEVDEASVDDTWEEEAE
jgi:type I restriction enzyme, S subunit